MVTYYECRHPLSCHRAEAKEASFHVKEEDKLLLPRKKQIKPRPMRALHNVYFVYIFLSIIILFKHVQKYSLNISVTP